MHIEVHRFKTTLKILTESSLGQILEALGIPRQFWKEKRDLRTGDLFAMECRLGSDKQSVYLILGRPQPRSCMNPQTGEVLDYGSYGIPPGYEKYYLGGSLLIHGGFFDQAQNFNFGRLLAILQATGYNPTELDVAHVDDKKVTKLSDWLEAFDKWRGCVVGNIVRRQPIDPVGTSTEFKRVQLGNGRSKTCYGTFYQRPDGSLRLELKYRKPAYIRQLLKQYDEEDRTAFNALALDVLVSSLDIVTPETKDTRKPVRAKFYADFLESTPKRVKRPSKKKQAKTQHEAVTTGAKWYAARVQNYARGLLIDSRAFIEVIAAELEKLEHAAIAT